MSNITNWCDKKEEHIHEALGKLFADKKNNAITKFLHPKLCNILKTDNPTLEKAKERDFSNADDIEYCFNAFQRVVAEINDNTMFFPTLENFSMFMGWSATILKQISENSNDDVMAVMDLIDDYITESQFTASQMGYIKTSITKFRTQVAGAHGQGLVTQKEENDNKRANAKTMSAEEALKKLQGTGIDIKTIESKAKKY